MPVAVFLQKRFFGKITTLSKVMSYFGPVKVALLAIAAYAKYLWRHVMD